MPSELRDARARDAPSTFQARDALPSSGGAQSVVIPLMRSFRIRLLQYGVCALDGRELAAWPSAPEDAERAIDDDVRAPTLNSLKFI
jgi:hypothetical protein